MNVAQKLAENPIARGIARFGPLTMVNSVMGSFPPRVPFFNGTIAKCRNVETYLLARSFNSGGHYRQDQFPDKIHGLADLGCNVGFFPLIMRHRLASGAPVLLVDADSRMVDEAVRNCADNGITASGCCGVVGGNWVPGEAVPFNVYQSTQCSTFATELIDRRLMPRKWRVQTVQKIDVWQEWCRAFRYARLDVLKVDVEGGEVGLLAHESDLFLRVRCVVMEMHHPVADVKAIVSLMRQLGFRLTLIDEHEASSVGYWTRIGA